MFFYIDQNNAIMLLRAAECDEPPEEPIYFDIPISEANFPADRPFPVAAVMTLVDVATQNKQIPVRFCDDSPYPTDRYHGANWIYIELTLPH